MAGGNCEETVWGRTGPTTAMASITKFDVGLLPRLNTFRCQGGESFGDRMARTTGTIQLYSSASHNCPENWWFQPLCPRQASLGVAITLVDRLSARRRLRDLEPTPHSPPQSTTYTLRSAQPSVTVREDLIVVDDNEPSGSGGVTNPPRPRMR